MATLRELKGRIGSVASSEKITGAMKMISSAKMHKAEGALRQLRPYRDQVETIIANIIGSDAAFSSPLMTPHTTVSNAAVVVWGSDDGLCGAYNINIFKDLRSCILECFTKCITASQHEGNFIGVYRVHLTIVYANTHIASIRTRQRPLLHTSHDTF